MKNKLLITTALVALISANNAFAQVSLPDLSVTDNQELTESTGVSYNTINVTKEGTLTLTGANIKTSTKDTPTTDITVNGTLNLKMAVSWKQEAILTGWQITPTYCWTAQP